MIAQARLRLDRLLVERGLAPTRAQAQALVLAGRVWCCGERLSKSGSLHAADAPLEIAPGRSHVGRGGLKLEGALERLEVEPAGADCLDVGASTGGFTEALLRAGARRVVALDVGHGQLDWGLRQDARVVVLERTNARWLRPEQLPFAPQLAVVDVAFISLTLVLAPVARCLAPGGRILALVKPQFEAGRRVVGRGGIVRDPSEHRAVLSRIVEFAAAQGWGVRGLCRSTPRGADGNREFFILLAPAGAGFPPERIERELAAVVEGGAEEEEVEP